MLSLLYYIGSYQTFNIPKKTMKNFTKQGQMRPLFKPAIFFKTLTTICGLFLFTFASAQISGTVFRDYNRNGVKNNSATFNESFVQGITVKAFNSLNVQLGTTKTTNASGAYSFTVAEIPATTAVRIEFGGLGTEDFSSSNGTGNGTNIQFATAPNAATNYAVNATEDYWDNIGQTNPKLLAIVYAHGDINHTNSANTTFGIVQIANNTTGSTPTVVNVATQAQVGSLWGMGVQKTHNRFFFGSFLKRHTGFGPKGVGGVYMATLSGANYALAGSFTLQGVTPSNSGTALDMGSVNRVSTPNTSDYYLATGSDAAGKDLDAFGKACKVGFGAVEVDDKNQQLILVNLNQRRLVTVDISGTTASLNNASTATLGPLTKAYDILTLPGVPSCVSGQLRPFALKIYKGRGYLGAVCDASATPRDSTNLAGYILSFDPANIAAGFTNEITLNLNYRTSTSNGNTNRWHSWADVWTDVKSSGLYRYPEPLISDIEFDENGGLNISITDRFGHQMGVSQTIPVAGSATVVGETRISGDLLHACRVGASWVMEGAAGSCTPVNNIDNTDGYGDGQAVGVYEYYDDESGDNTTGEYTQGAMAKLMGTNQLVQTMVDPTPAPGTTGQPYWYTAGMHWYDVNTGGWNNWTSLYDGDNTAGGFMKGNGLGDIEFITTPQPIQIGNRVWVDTNGNGIQDAGETTTVVTGTTVTLRSPGIDGIYNTADDQTWTTTTDATGNYYFSALSSADNRKPAAWAGVGNTILPGYNYRIEIAIPAGYQVTKSDAANNSFDNIDNDATVSASGTIAYVTFNTSNVNHSFDFGFKPLASIGDKVWLDNGVGGGTAADGLQNGTEPGVAGITVSLYNNAGTFIGSTITDAFGNYLFDNLAAGNYTVGFTLPANYTFTTQTNSADDGNTTGVGATATSINGSDANATTGKTYLITLTAGENNRNIDAGIIFNNSTAVTQSIGDKVWLDNGTGGGTAADGIQNGTEPGVSGVNVTLYNSSGIAIAATKTDAKGNYLFSNVPTGNYTVGFSLPSGFVFSPNNGAVSNATNSDANLTTGRTATITVASGNNITYVDAGIYAQATTKASLGDRVWEDVNHNGLQDANEPGIGGVTVNLYQGATLVATTTTDPFGYYMFTNLDPATYQVEFIKPIGYTISPQRVSGVASATDSDPSAVTGRTLDIGLVAGNRNTATDAGMYKTAPAGTLRLGDKVFNDYNKDGIQTANEPGVPGITVALYQNGADGLPGTLDDVLVATTFTDVDGLYTFVNLAASTGASTNYNVQYSNLPSGFVFSPATVAAGTTATDSNPLSNGRTGSINLIANDFTLDAGVTTGIPAGKGSLGDKVFYDLNSNGVQEAGELGVANVTVTLQKDINGDGIYSGVAETAFATTTTNATGQYMFGGLDAGSYRVVFSNMPTGYVIAPKNAAAATFETDSDGDNAGTTITGVTTSTTGTYVLADGEDNLSVDLGIIQPASRNTLGDFVWNDKNGDGLQSVGEPGLQGVMVTLYNNAGTAIAYTVTDANGLYLFTGVADGTYSVGFSNQPAGFDFTGKSVSNDLTGSDADILSGRTANVTLTYASGGTLRDNRSLDAGFISTRASLGNYVWLDANSDGVQDATEKGIAGVTVTLYASDGTTVLASCITDQNGKYYFSNLPAASYVVGFGTTPSNLQFTQQNSPGDNGNNTNSDADLITGKSSVIVLSAGEVDETIDAGIRGLPVATVGDYIWADINSDGIQDANEPGIAGMLVTLFNSLNQPIGSAITDGNGKYLITNVPPGTGYYIVVGNLPTNPSGIQPSPTTQGGAGGTTTSHINASAISNTFNVNAGDNITNIDAGIKDYALGAILPLQSLVASATLNGSTANISWISKNEINTNKFIVERSIDNRTFTAVGEKAAAGTYSGTSNYALPDNISSLINNTVIYYRIKAVDNDGAFSYSNVVVVRLDSKATVSVWPNPFVKDVTISITSKTATMLNLRVLDYAGKTLVVKQYQLSRGINQLYLENMSALSPGMYILEMTDETGSIDTNERLIKQ